MGGRTEPYIVPLRVFSWRAMAYGVMGARTAMAAMPTMTATPAGTDGVKDLQRGLLAADGVEGIIDPAPVRELAHPLHDVVLLAIEGVGRPKLLGIAELAVEKIAGHDHPGPGQLCALHHVEADTAAADHEHGGARLHSRARGDGAHAGGNATAHESGLRPRHLLP